MAEGYEVSWSAPADNGGSITGYEVRYRIENSDGTWPATWTLYATTDASTTTITISLPASSSATTQQAFAWTNTADVQVQVRAVSNLGNGDWSAQPPDAPAALQVTPVGAGLTATWTAPASNGAPITGYSVQYRVKDTDQTQTGDQPGSWIALTRQRRSGHEHHRHDHRAHQRHRLPDAGEGRQQRRP